MRERRVEIKNKHGETLVGVEVLPDTTKDKYPTVIMVHGFAYFKEEDGMFVELGKRLANMGIASYRFDFSGCGESEGDYSNTTLTKLRDDLSHILEFASSQRTTDIQRIGIFGQSFGTTVTIALAPQIKGIVLMGSFMDGKKVLYDFFGEGYHPDGVSQTPRSDGSVTKINPTFWKDFENHNMLALLRKIKCPLLLIHGSKDLDVPIANMEQIFANANEPKGKVILEGADHGLQPKREEMYEVVVNWFSKTL